MEESTAEANADTLKQELKKILTEISHDGLVGEESEDFSEPNGRNGDLRAIDEAIRILARLRKIESKKMESDISSSSPLPLASVEVPKEFICSLSKKIMIEPVVISSGQTYEKRSIEELLRSQRICPETGEFISDSSLRPNHLINELITKWCQLNNFDRPKPPKPNEDMSTDGFDSLLQRISSSSSVDDQTEAAKELRYRTKTFGNAQDFFVTQLPDSITNLLIPLTNLGEEVDLYPDLQEHIVTILFNISVLLTNKTVIAENPFVIPLLTKSLTKGTDATRRNSAATLASLSIIDSNKIIIGKSRAVNGLVDMMRYGDMLATYEAASAIYNISSLSQNREMVVLTWLIPVAISNIRAGSNVELLVTLLAMITTQTRAIEEMEFRGFRQDLLSILREPCSQITCGNALLIVLNMCERDRDKYIIRALAEEEKQNGTFKKCEKQGNIRVAGIAKLILERIKRFVSGKGILMT